jgi:hypothetical protein
LEFGANGLVPNWGQRWTGIQRLRMLVNSFNSSECLPILLAGVAEADPESRSMKLMRKNLLFCVKIINHFNYFIFG